MQKDKHHCQKLLVEKLKYRVTITKSSRGSSKPNSTQTPKSQIQSKPYPNTATHTLRERKTTNAQKGILQSAIQPNPIQKKNLKMVSN
jgi:hypothetical protein